MKAWLRRHFRLLAPGMNARTVPDDLWQRNLAHFPFFNALDGDQTSRLRRLTEMFLGYKEFQGAQGLVVSDEMAVAVASQACLPLLHITRTDSPKEALRWYDDFVGIVLHPAEVLARRETIDEFGVVHRYAERLSGEAMEGGPVMLNWADVDAAGASAEQGYNVVIHEFVHKMDMRDGIPDGCPPLPAGFLGTRAPRAARQHWERVLRSAYDSFRDAVIRAERFGGDPPWLDAYGAESRDEFFAVACEAYFVNRTRFSSEFPALIVLFDAFFRPGV
jgi:hypothetical protein